MGEGGGFPWVRAVVSLVSPKSLVVCLNTKGAINNIIKHVDWFDVDLSE
jgi:hypothetical protein